MKILSTFVEAHIFRVKNEKVEYLILRRDENEAFPNLWQMVTGRCDENEKGFETAIRELKEETSLNPINLWVVPIVNSFYSEKSDSIFLIPVFLFRCNENDEVILSSEHSEYEWCSFEVARSRFAWSGQRESITLVNEFLTKKNSALNFIEILL